MGKEIKICLPLYKLLYSVFYIAVLSVVRGVGFTFEIGIALEPMMALLAAVFCADTYVQEIVSKRSEVERLYPMKRRMVSMYRRIAIQGIYLFVLSATGYGMFLAVQRPVSFCDTKAGEVSQFGVYMAAVAVTLVFWGMLSHTLSCLFRTMWAGIGGCLALWVITNSLTGERILGKWNLFSYAFRNIRNSGDLSWICGKLVCILLCLFMAAMLPEIVRKRG